MSEADHPSVASGDVNAKYRKNTDDDLTRLS